MSQRKITEAIGESEAFLEFQERLSKVAKVDRSVLIIGERGTGKELAAARLHYLSQRWGENLTALNCAALPPSLVESELFGYEPGAFTGAVKRRIGRFESAHRGTLFLDEIGAIPLEVQAKILRVVEYQTFERVGSSQEISVNVRIIGATNADLPKLAQEGKFKHDLLDRLSFEVLSLPPLRERKGDITLLALNFAAHMAHELNMRNAPTITDSGLEQLENFFWPGNVRELKNVVERAVYKSITSEIYEFEFDPFNRSSEVLSDKRKEEAHAGYITPSIRPENETNDLGFFERVEQLELSLITEALVQAEYRQKQAAAILKVSYNQFRSLFRKYKNKNML